MCGQCDFASMDLTIPVLPDFHPASAGLVVMGEDLGAVRMRRPARMRRPQAPALSDVGGPVDSEVYWLD